MPVFVLDQRKHPLMPCSERRARLLLSRKRAVVHRVWPFTIRLKDRSREASQVQPIALKLDPGSKTTGMALVRIEPTQDGEIHHAVQLADLTHRGEVVHRALQQRAGYRRRRRSANLRHRPPRFANRGRQSGWLPPSLRSRIGNVLTWARRYGRWAPLSRIEIERVKFDMALLQDPEITGILYQRGELFGWEIRSYLLEKFGRRCVYCGRGDTAFEIDHVVPRSRGGTDRVSNLVLSCHDCNSAKGDQTAAEFGHPHVEGEAQLPLRDAAASVWHREGPLSRCPLRRRRGWCSRACLSHAQHRCAWTWELPAHECGRVWLPTWVLDASEARAGLFDRRSGARTGA